MLHAYGLFAAHYAPVVTRAQATDTGRSTPLIYLVPIAHDGTEPCAMVPLAKGAATFGVQRNLRIPAKEQAETASAFIRSRDGMETEFAAFVDGSSGDAVVMLPWGEPPTHVVRDSGTLALAPGSWGATMRSYQTGRRHTPGHSCSHSSAH